MKLFDYFDVFQLNEQQYMSARFSVFRLFFYAVVPVLVAVYVATIFEGKGKGKMATKPSNHYLNGWC